MQSRFSIPSNCYGADGRPTPEFTTYINGFIARRWPGGKAFDAALASKSEQDRADAREMRDLFDKALDRCAARQMRDAVFAYGRPQRQRDSRPVNSARPTSEPFVDEGAVIFGATPRGEILRKSDFGAIRPPDQKKLADFYNAQSQLQAPGTFKAIEYDTPSFDRSSSFGRQADDDQRRADALFNSVGAGRGARR